MPGRWLPRYLGRPARPTGAWPPGAYGLAAREPITATHGRAVRLGSPAVQRTAGGSGMHERSAGYRGSHGGSASKPSIPAAASAAAPRDRAVSMASARERPSAGGPVAASTCSSETWGSPARKSLKARAAFNRDTGSIDTATAVSRSMAKPRACAGVERQKGRDTGCRRSCAARPRSHYKDRVS